MSSLFCASVYTIYQFLCSGPNYIDASPVADGTAGGCYKQPHTWHIAHCTLHIGIWHKSLTQDKDTRHNARVCIFICTKVTFLFFNPHRSSSPSPRPNTQDPGLGLGSGSKSQVPSRKSKSKSQSQETAACRSFGHGVALAKPGFGVCVWVRCSHSHHSPFAFVIWRFGFSVELPFST